MDAGRALSYEHIYFAVPLMSLSQTTPRRDLATLIELLSDDPSTLPIVSLIRDQFAFREPKWLGRARFPCERPFLCHSSEVRTRFGKSEPPAG